MVRTVHLHGRLAEEFGSEFLLDVVSPAEAVRALVVQLGTKFRDAVRAGEWHIVAGETWENGVDYGADPSMLHLGLGTLDLHIVPAVRGSGKNGLFGLVIGVILICVAWYAAPAVVGAMGPTLGMGTTAFSAFGASVTYGQIAMIGASMALSGAMSMLSSTPQLSSGYSARDTADEQRSYLFNGPKNTSEQGGPVPVVYGRQRVGWTLISSGTTVEQVKGQYGGQRNDKPNTLQSKAIIRVLGVISEGPIGGLVDGEKSIYFGDTPLVAADGSKNFEGVTWHYRPGDADQEFIPGFASVENETEVKAEVSSKSPVVRTISNTENNALRIRLKLNGLYCQDKKGNINAHKMDVAIDVRQQGDDWVETVTDTFQGKTTSAYERTYRIELPDGGPWDIRVRKLTKDAETVLISDTLNWAAYTEIVDTKYTYPHSALIGLEIDSEEFGETIPTVSFEIYGRKVLLPSNYNPQTRTYTGVWDGTFQEAYSDNAAWCAYDMITHPRYGLPNSPATDKWEIYEMGVNSDELVDDGYGGKEPRYTMNCVLQRREDAYSVINTLISVCRGMAYWASGAILFSQDRFKEPSFYLSQADVENGEFTYTGSTLSKRHTAALVSFNDPEDNYKAGIEPVENANGIKRYGYRSTDIVDYGARSKGQAHRTGRWALETEQHATDSVCFVTGLKHADMMPGDVIAVADDTIAGIRYGGRVVDAAADTITIDAPVEILAEDDYTLTVVLPDRTAVDVAITNEAGETSVLTLSESLTTLPQKGAVWVLSASSVLPQLFSVIYNKSDDPDRCEISALEYDPNKYARVEQGLKFDPRPTSLTKSLLPPIPSELAFDEFLYTSGEGMSPGVLFSWSSAKDEALTYVAQIMRPGETWETFGTTSTTSVRFENTTAGTYSFRVRSVSLSGAQSKWVELSNRKLKGMSQAPNDVTGLVFVISANGGVLSWDPVEDWRSVQYEVRRGNSWSTAQLMGRTADTTMGIGPDGTYLVRALAGGSYSDHDARVVVDGGNIVSNVVATLDESGNNWPGTFGGDAALNNGGDLWLTGADMKTGTYTIAEASRVKLAETALCSVSVAYDVYAHGLEQDVYAIKDIYAVVDIYGNFGEYVTVTPQIRLYKLGAWGEWQRYMPGDYAAEQFDFRLVLSTSRTDVTPVVTNFVITVDVPDHVEAEAINIPASGASVKFQSAYNVIPSVVCQIIDAQGGEDVVVSNKTTIGFDVVVNSGGSGVARSVNYIAQGY